jgi:hypothetical protein
VAQPVENPITSTSPMQPDKHLPLITFPSGIATQKHPLACLLAGHMFLNVPKQSMI